MVLLSRTFIEILMNLKFLIYSSAETEVRDDGTVFSFQVSLVASETVLANVSSIFV